MGWGVLGAAWIAERALLPALVQAGNARLAAIASRSPERAATLAARFGVERVAGDYEALLADPAVEAVYVPLPNSLHLEWTLRALEAGKHVLCEKPLALNAAEGERMAAAARASGRLLMEAAMWRFRSRNGELEAAARRGLNHLHAAFSFHIDQPGNYRLDPELGGGALLDVGFYVADAARWLLGEPEEVRAVMSGGPVDMSVSAVLGYASGAHAFLYAGFEAAGYEELSIAGAAGVLRLEQPFTGPDGGGDPYLRMVEAFGAAVLAGAEAPLPLAGSLATLRILDRIRAAARG